MDRRMIQKPRINHYDLGTSPIPKIKHLIANHPFQLMKFKLPSIDLDLELGVMYEACCKNRKNFPWVRKVAHDFD